ncbi:MAG TPA: RDD family protein [Solirubrobacteraceae bacterium]|jgi:hypothetical protein|nr:RDD family protein [Solirubrobacteraceae bacterium]
MTPRMVPAERKHLDARRLGAIFVDLLLLAPIELLAFRYERGVQALATALALVYFYLSDTTSGQTAGKALFKLRTVTLDGEIVSGRAAASRTVLRIVDQTIVGPIVMVCTGQRRQRLGDLAARTAVVDARDVAVSRPLEASMLLYPAAWLVPALIVFTLTAMGRFPGSYRVVADAVCEQADALVPAARVPSDLAVLARAEADDLASIQAPPHWRDRHAVLVAEYRAFSQRLERVLWRTSRSRDPQARWRVEWPRLQRRMAVTSARLAQLGYEDCAGNGGSAAY